MIRACLAFFFLLTTTTTYARQLMLKGTVVDAQTRQPIAAATISISAIGAYYRTYNKGKFEIISDTITPNDTVAFSCIGYQAKKITVDNLLHSSTVELQPGLNILNEVKISTKLVPLIKVGSKRRTGYELWATHPEDRMAMYMEGSKDITGTIKAVGFFLTKGHGMFKGGDVTTPFSIRLFMVDTNGMPGEELTKDSIIVSAKKEWSWFDVDISSYHIQNPDSGFFVSFNLLDYTHYKPLNKASPNIVVSSLEDSKYRQVLTPEEGGDVKFNTPRICLTSDEFKPARSYFYGYDLEDNRLHWVEMYGNQSFMIRAAIAPE